MIEAGERKAEQLGIPYNLAVVGKPLFGIHSTNHERVVIFAGGLLVKLDGAVIGAIGASGGTVQQDEKVVEAALAEFTKSAKEAA